MNLNDIQIENFPCKDIAKAMSEQLRYGLAGTEFEDLAVADPKSAIVREDNASAYTIHIQRNDKNIGMISIYQDKKDTNICWHCEKADKRYPIKLDEMNMLTTRILASREADLDGI